MTSDEAPAPAATPAAAATPGSLAAAGTVLGDPAPSPLSPLLAAAVPLVARFTDALSNLIGKSDDTEAPDPATEPDAPAPEAVAPALDLSATEEPSAPKEYAPIPPPPERYE